MLNKQGVIEQNKLTIHIVAVKNGLSKAEKQLLAAKVEKHIKTRNVSV